MSADLVPLALVEDLARATGDARTLLWALVASHGPAGCSLTQPDLAARLGVSVRTLARATAALEDAGWLSVERAREDGEPSTLRALRLPPRYRGTGGDPAAEPRRRYHSHPDADALVADYLSCVRTHWQTVSRVSPRRQRSQAALLLRQCGSYERARLVMLAGLRERWESRQPPTIGWFVSSARRLLATTRHAMMVEVESADPVWRALVHDDPTCRVVDDLVIRVDVVDHGDQTDEDAERLAREILAEGRAAGAGGPVRVTVTYYTDDRNGHARAEVSADA